MSEVPAARQLADDLARVRQRGLDGIDDHDPPKQLQMGVDVLTRLSNEYCTRRGLQLEGRIAQIRQLLRDGLAAYADRGDTEDSRLISRLLLDATGTTGPTDMREAVKKEAGWSDNQFEYRWAQKRGRFATFLIAFVAGTIPDSHTVESAAPKNESQSETIAAPATLRRRQLIRIGAAMTALVMIAAVVAAVLIERNNGGMIGGSIPSPTTSSHPTSPPYVSGKNYTEQADNRHGSATFTDPHHPYVTGVTIDYTTKVQVSCKVYAVPPGWDSVTPDGYWYRIASPPWNNKYYAIANTFLNGDSPNGPTMHNTDFNVPDCPN